MDSYTLLCADWRWRENLVDNCIQNFHLVRHIVGYTVVNLLMATHQSSRKRDFRTYIRPYTSPNEHFEYSNPHPNAVLT